MEDEDLVARAEEAARRLHDGQMRKGEAGEPYAAHLQEVATLVAAWGGDPLAVALAWLHDTVEDNPGYEVEDVEEEFGAELAALVAELTDDDAVDEPTRRRRQVEAARRASPRAALVKLADKTSNLRGVAVAPPAGWSRDYTLAYVAWGEEVVAALPEPLPRQGLDAFAQAAHAARIVATAAPAA
jgi:(p)ppGpp synthase/HD superfamily hydrolase